MKFYSGLMATSEMIAEHMVRGNEQISERILRDWSPIRTRISAQRCKKTVVRFAKQRIRPKKPKTRGSMETLTEEERGFMVGVLDEKIKRMRIQIDDVQTIKEKLLNGSDVFSADAAEELLTRESKPEDPPAEEPKKEKPKRVKVEKQVNRRSLLKKDGKKPLPSQVKTLSKKYRHILVLGNGRFCAKFFYDFISHNKTFDTEIEAAEYTVEVKGLESIEDILRD